MTLNPSIFRIHHLERLPLKTPYPAQVQRIRYLMAHLPRGAALIVDFTGVGRGVYDMLVEGGLAPIGVMIHSGFNVHSDDLGATFTVPKLTRVSTLVARMHGGELFVQGDLKEWAVLRRELLNFRSEITRGGTETWNARSGEHDDLVLALALALWHLNAADIPYRGLLDYYRREAGEPGGGTQWAVGVDLGQAQDPTAIAILSKIDQPSQSDVTNGDYHRQDAA